MHGQVDLIHRQHALPRLNKIRKEPILDPEATRHQQAGTGIWHHDTPRKAQKQQHKKVAEYRSNTNWQGSRRNDMEADNQVFGTNEAEIKQKSLEAISYQTSQAG
jgi:hypothetical protein